MINVSAAPFNLDADAAEWVNTTLAGMDLRAKVGHLFHLVCRVNDAEGIRSVLDVATPNGFMLRALPAADVVPVARLVQDAAPIPMLLSADVERGANGLYVEGTSFASAMQVAATCDVTFAERLGTVIAREAGALGCTWAFSPIVDIQYSFSSPITNIRCFGSDRTRCRPWASRSSRLWSRTGWPQLVGRRSAAMGADPRERLAQVPQRDPDGLRVARQPVPPPGRTASQDLHQRVWLQQGHRGRRRRQAARTHPVRRDEPRRPVLRVLGHASVRRWCRLGTASTEV